MKTTAVSSDPRCQTRGSVLIVAMLLAALISVALVSYLKLSNNSLKMSQRIFLQNAAINLAEMGVERALTSFNHAVNGDANAWAGWTINGAVATRTISGFVPVPGATGVIKLYVQNQNSGSTATISPDDHSWDDHSSDDESEHEDGGSFEVASLGSPSLARGAIEQLTQRARTVRHLTAFAAGSARTVWRQPVLIGLAFGIRPVASLNWAGGLPILATLSGVGDDDDDHDDDDDDDEHSYSDDHLSDNHGSDNHSDDDHDTPATSASSPVTSSSIVIVAKAIITPSDGGSPFVKMIEVQVAQRSTWGYGLVGRASVRLDSNATADSWNSDPDNDPATAPVVYNADTNRRDNGTVGVVSATNGALSLGSNASVYGTVNTGGGTITSDSNVRVYGATSPATPRIDPSRVHRDFNFTFPTITEPTPSVVNNITPSVTDNRTFPNGTSDMPASDGKYYYRFAEGAAIDLDSNRNLTVNGNVVWLFQNHQGVNSIHTSSNANVIFQGTTSTLDIYTNGDIRLDSNCDINRDGQPSRFKIYGTSTSSQALVMSSNATISGVLYSPNASYSIDSNCRLFGSVVANTIDVDSQAAFHYDEALGLFGSGNPFRVTSWRELRSASERATYASQFNF